MLIDFTPMAGPAATSVLKAAYFRDWRDGAFVHVSDMGGGRIGAAAGVDSPCAIEDGDVGVGRLLELFQPEIIVYRPVADSPALHAFAMAAIARAIARGAGLALWLMDDWPARLEGRDPARFAEMDGDLRCLLAQAGARFAISEGMARAFEKRYGVAFDVAHNGVNADSWPVVSPPRRDHLVVRYAGSLAPDTTKDSVFDVARAVAEMANADGAENGRPIVFEGRSHAIWLKQCGDELNALANVTFAESNLSAAEYRRWLSGADVLLVSYNFDEKTRTYLQYSFANKVPETMAAGAAILAYGPEELETIDYLRRHRLAEIVSIRDQDRLRDALSRLAYDDGRRRLLADSARRHALTNFDLNAMKTAFKEKLEPCAPSKNESGDETAAAARDVIAVVAKTPSRRSSPGLSLLEKIRRRFAAL